MYGVIGTGCTCECMLHHNVCIVNTTTRLVYLRHVRIVIWRDTNSIWIDAHVQSHIYIHVLVGTCGWRLCMVQHRLIPHKTIPYSGVSLNVVLHGKAPARVQLLYRKNNNIGMRHQREWQLIQTLFFLVNIRFNGNDISVLSIRPSISYTAS